MKKKKSLKFLLSVLIIFLVGFVNACTEYNTVEEENNDLIKVSRDGIINQIKNQGDISLTLDLCHKYESAKLLVDCSTKMICQGPMCYEALLDILRENNDELKFHLLCEEIGEREIKKVDSYGKTVIEEKWKSSNCKKRYSQG